MVTDRRYRWLLRLYPRAFRERYGAEMAADAAAMLAAAPRRRRPALWAGLARDALVQALAVRRERRAETRAARRDRPFHSQGEHMHSIVQDLKLAMRGFVRQPGFTASVILTLALGTGATVAFFSIVDAAVLRPLPYPRPAGLMAVRQVDPKFGPQPFGPPYLEDLRARLHAFSRLAGFSPTWMMTLRGLGDPAVVAGAFVSDGVFDLLGAAPVEGRAFRPEEYAPGGPRVVMVSRTFWNRWFGPGVRLSDQRINLEGQAYAIVGILPGGFRLPITTSLVNDRADAAELWLPFALNPYATLRQIPVMNVVGRLAPSASPDAANAELATVGRALARDYPATGRWTTLRADSLYDVVTAGLSRVVLLLFGAAAFLLLVACANIANLTLARASARRHELALRASLGATRRRLVRQLLVESLVLALAGGAAGLLVAWWALSAVPALGLEGLPASAIVRVDLRVAVFAAALAGVVAVAFGLAPALQASRPAPAALLRDGGRAVTGRNRLRDGLAAAEIALSLVLLAGGALLAKSFWQLTRVDPGFHSAGLVAAPVDLTGRQLPDGAARLTMVDRLLARLDATPGVSRAAAVNRIPLGGSFVFVGVEIEGRPETASAPIPVDRLVATTGYFPAMGVPIAAGRDFGIEDRAAGAARVAIVNETAARRLWPDGAVGRRLRLALRGGPGPWLTIVGVAGDVHHHGLDQAVEPQVYVPYAQSPVESVVLLARTGGAARAVIPAVKEAIWSVDRDMALDTVRTLDQIVSASVASPRFRMLLVGGFALLAVLLAALGIYGVVSYSVALRTRDIGLRMALGAQPREVLALVAAEGLRLAAWGVGAGLVASLAVTRLLSGFLFEVSPTDPLAIGAVTLLLAAIALAATLIPARRATRVDPVIALRAE